MIISEVVIPQMFTAYAEHIGRVSNYLNHMQYFCEECGQAFASAWGTSPGNFGGYERGSFFHCTHCGKIHHKHVAYVRRHEDCPTKVRLSLKTFKDVVVFEVYYEAFYFDDVFGVRAKKGGKETFRFNIAKQTATFSCHYGKGAGEQQDLGNPFKLEILEESILRFFTANSLALTNQKKELVAFAKELREAIRIKMEKQLGHKIKPLYVSSGTLRGMFLVPLQNMAFRVTFPDAHNLPAVYRDRREDINKMLERHMLLTIDFFMTAKIDEAIKKARKGTDFITAVISTLDLPNTNVVRREIGKNLFECGRLLASFKFCKNYDYAIRFHSGLKTIVDNYKGTFSNRDLYYFSRTILKIYGEGGVVTLLENADTFNLKDCIRIFIQLNKDGKKDLIAERVRLRDLHDWLARKHRKQDHKNLILDVPNHIIKRLSMQKDK